MTRPITAGFTSPLAEHQATISRLLVILGIVVLLIVVAGRLARRVGGWYFVWRRVSLEIRLTTTAFAAPVRSWFRYRRRLRSLSRLLADPAVWQAGERAMRSVDAVTPGGCHPYATVVGTDLVGVFVAGLEVPEPPTPWVADDDDPHLWWSVREAWNDPPAGGQDTRPVLLAAVGVDGRRAVFLDLADGPSVTALYGDERATGAILQAVAAQLDRRLPPGAVTVAEGVHPRHAGPPVAQALRDAARWREENDAPAFAVCAEPLPDPAGPDTPFVLVRGRAQGRVRLLTVDRNGGIVVHGTPLRPEAAALPRAVARAIGSVPPHRAPSARTVRAEHVVVDAPVLGRSASATVADAARATTGAEPITAHAFPPAAGASPPVPVRPAHATGVSASTGRPPAEADAGDREHAPRATRSDSTCVPASAEGSPVEGPPAWTGDRAAPPDPAPPAPMGVSASAGAHGSGPPGTATPESGDGD
jgi:hypothetical protein